jgi:hypothetical protein
LHPSVEGRARFDATARHADGDVGDHRPDLSRRRIFTHFPRDRRAAGLPDDLEFRDLRRTAAVQLAEAGCSPPEIAAITGHSIERTAAILEVYVPRNSIMAGHAITKLEDYRRTQQERKLEGRGE